MKKMLGCGLCIGWFVLKSTLMGELFTISRNGNWLFLGKSLFRISKALDIKASKVQKIKDVVNILC